MLDRLASLSLYLLPEVNALLALVGCRRNYWHNIPPRNCGSLQSGCQCYGVTATTERGGTIVIDKDRVIGIRPKYFVQRRLIDHEGNLVEMGLEEEFLPGAITGVKMRPSVSELLFRNVASNGYAPILRYHSFPYTSDFMFTILDAPMSASRWADLFIDPKGKGSCLF